MNADGTAFVSGMQAFTHVPVPSSFRLRNYSSFVSSTYGGNLTCQGNFRSSRNLRSVSSSTSGLLGPRPAGRNQRRSLARARDRALNRNRDGSVGRTPDANVYPPAPVETTTAIFVWSGSSPVFGDDDSVDDHDDDFESRQDQDGGGGVGGSGDESDDSPGGFSIDDRLFGGSAAGGSAAGGGLGGAFSGNGAYGGGSSSGGASGLSGGGLGGSSGGLGSSPPSSMPPYASAMFDTPSTLEGSAGANRLYEALREYSQGPDDLGRMRKEASGIAADAFKRTVLGIVGVLPSEAYEVSITSDRGGLARLMHSSLCTGYAIRNAEFRMLLNEGLAGSGGASPRSKRGRPFAAPAAHGVDEAKTEASVEKPDGEDKEPEYMRNVPFRNCFDASGVQGSVLWWDDDKETKQEMCAQEYVSRLEAENDILRDRLAAKTVHDEQGGNRLLDFMKTLSGDKIADLQQGISGLTEDAFRRVIKSVLGDMDTSRVQTTYGTSRDYLAQITFWCLLVGYTVRILEKRNEMQALFEDTESLASPMKSPSSSPSVQGRDSPPPPSASSPPSESPSPPPSNPSSL